MGEVLLTEVEMKIARWVAVMRRQHSMANGNKDRSLGRSDTEADIRGVAGEIAAAKYMNIYWPPSVNAPKSQPDLLPNFQVRSTHYKDGRLPFRPGDVPHHTYVLVITSLPRCRVAGWIAGDNAQQQDFWEGDCWWVPQARLRPLKGRFDDRA